MDSIFNTVADAVIISSPHNLRYHTGFTGGEGYAVISPDKKILYVDGRYTVQARTQASDFDVVEYSDNVFSKIAEHGFDSIGFEDDYISYSIYKRMNFAIKARFTGVSDKLEKLRCIKTKAETENIQKAEQIGDAAFKHILSFIKEDVTEKELADEIEFFMRKNGAEKTSFDTIVAFGERAALPHAYPTDRQLKKGALVLMDFGCVYNGYCGDMTRTVCFGKATDRQREIYNLVLKAQLESLKAIKSGENSKSVDAVARNIFEEAGFAKLFNHSLGHGTGLLIHELPNLSPRSDAVLCEGNVVTVEPGLYFENEFGVRIEDLVVVTKDGYSNLTSSPKELIEIM